MTDAERLARIAAIEKRIAEIKARLPRHSPPTPMLVDVDELEDELARLQDVGEARPTGEGAVSA